MNSSLTARFKRISAKLKRNLTVKMEMIPVDQSFIAATNELPSSVFGRGDTVDATLANLASAIERYAEELHGSNDDGTSQAADPAPDSA